MVESRAECGLYLSLLVFTLLRFFGAGFSVWTDFSHIILGCDPVLEYDFSGYVAEAVSLAYVHAVGADIWVAEDLFRHICFDTPIKLRFITPEYLNDCFAQAKHIDRSPYSVVAGLSHR